MVTRSILRIRREGVPYRLTMMRMAIRLLTFALLRAAQTKAGGVSGADLIQALLDNGNFGYGTFNQNSVAAFAGQVNADGTPVGVPSTAALTVNANGAFFQANATAGSRFKVGTPGYIGGTLQAQATILIHELAHILGAAGFQPDAGNATAGSANDKLVNQDCGKLIGGLK
jgi:hypothetical protein